MLRLFCFAAENNIAFFYILGKQELIKYKVYQVTVKCTRSL